MGVAPASVDLRSLPRSFRFDLDRGGSRNVVDGVENARGRGARVGQYDFFWILARQECFEKGPPLGIAGIGAGQGRELRKRFGGVRGDVGGQWRRIGISDRSLFKRPR